MTDELYGSQAPVFKVDGQEKGELARDLLHLAVEETTGGLKTFTARFVAQGPIEGTTTESQLYLDGRIFDFGKRIEVSIGPTEAARTIFQGNMSGLEVSFAEAKAPEVTVFAEDRAMDLRMTRRMRTYERMTDAQIAEAIASEHGLRSEVDADGPAYDVVQQWNMSDLAFLRERGRLIQAEIWLLNDTLHFKTRDKRGGEEITLVQGNHVSDLQIRADLAHQRTSVKVGGYDAESRDKIESEAGSDVIQSEITSGRSGVAILEQAFGTRVSYRVREVPLVTGEADAWARAEMLRRSRQFVTVTGVTRGTPEMVVGSIVYLENVGRVFEGPGYYVTRVRQMYGNDGFRTRFDAERAIIQEGA